MTLLYVLVLSILSCVYGAPTTTFIVTATPATAISTTVIETTLPTTVQITIASGRSSIVTNIVELATTSYVLTYAPTLTASAATTSATKPATIHLDTKVNAAWGVTGALLILTGLPMAFWGHKNRWSSYFLIGFYTLSLTCLALILKFGVLQEVNAPSIKLQGLFVLACVVAGIAGGGIAIFFWKGARYFVGCWGGFAFALYVQCFHNGGLVRPIGFRWLMYIALSAVGFIACTFPRLHYPVMLASTAFVGSTAVILGVDCLSTAGLKEFYISNLGFDSLFVPFTSHNMLYPISQTMMIELGLIAVVTLMGVAVQLRFYKVLKNKMREIEQAERKRELQRDEQAAERFKAVQNDLNEWEKDHGEGVTTLGGGTPMSKDIDSTTMLPTLDLGGKGDMEDLSGGMVKSTSRTATSIFAPRSKEDPELKEKLAMLEEIRKVRQNIETLRRSASLSAGSSESPGPSSVGSPIDDGFNKPIARPKRPVRPYSRATETLDVSRISRTLKLPDDPEKAAWDDYAKDRKLFTPPAGVSVPIPTSQLAMSPAVKEALERRLDLERTIAGEDAAAARGRRGSMLSSLDLERGSDRDQRRSTSRMSKLSTPFLSDSDRDRRRSGEASSSMAPARERKLSTGRLSALTIDGLENSKEIHRRGSIGSVLDRAQRVQSSTSSPPQPATPREESSTDSPTFPTPLGNPASPSPPAQPTARRPTSMMPNMPFHGAQEKVAAFFSASKHRPSQSESVSPISPLPAAARNRQQGLSVSPTAAVIPRRHQPPKVASPPAGRAKSPPTASPFTAQTPSELATIAARHREKMKKMQEPITREQKERKTLDDAKERWERSRVVERKVMEKKQREREMLGPEEEEDRKRNPAADKVFAWQKRSSTMLNMDEERRKSRRLSTGDDLQRRRYSGLPHASPSPPADNGYTSAAERPLQSGPGPQSQRQQQRPVNFAPPISADRRSSTSRSLDAWKLFSSPGMQRPPSDDDDGDLPPASRRPISPN